MGKLPPPLETIAEWVATEAIKTDDPNATISALSAVGPGYEPDPFWADMQHCVLARARVLLTSEKEA